MARKADKTDIDAVKNEPAKSRRNPTESPKTNVETIVDIKKPEAKKTAPAKKDPVFTTIIQFGNKEFDITGIAEKAYRTYKSVHRRKIVADFVVYVKPEENAAYYTVNGEGSEEYKIEL